MAGLTRTSWAAFNIKSGSQFDQGGTPRAARSFRFFWDRKYRRLRSDGGSLKSSTGDFSGCRLANGLQQRLSRSEATIPVRENGKVY
ncbi:hypothetical protein GWI33_011323 [Rhynchophorus ferrugineus]|uniref:Uncharacterized protein n=1 Tax=Rhynchophorus ferrugineus TaxID=354439 RepID=A0A834I732_RHYFE|nr:hypothetical protein GWI33_011323 [Rhynchophorus ferrugineus]